MAFCIRRSMKIVNIFPLNGIGDIFRSNLDCVWLLAFNIPSIFVTQSQFRLDCMKRFARNQTDFYLKCMHTKSKFVSNNSYMQLIPLNWTYATTKKAGSSAEIICVMSQFMEWILVSVNFFCVHCTDDEANFAQSESNFVGGLVLNSNSN